ncbi:MAG: hypothetical protein IBX62_02600 [Coriobacteriia bacterium]|nr:hypothetical protein [Coriobacteriia bacterium]
MSKAPLSRLILIVGGILAVLAATAALLLRVDWSAGFAGCTWTAAFGWTVPLIAGLVIAAVAWLLLRTRPARSDEGIGFVAYECPACGERVIKGWRLCPYCGNMLGTLPEPFRPEDAA